MTSFSFCVIGVKGCDFLRPILIFPLDKQLFRAENSCRRRSSSADKLLSSEAFSDSDMNHCLPDWNFENGLPITNQKKPIGADNELVELLWRNGQVVLHSQTTRKQAPSPDESNPAAKQDQPPLKGTGQIGAFGNSDNLLPNDETVPWIQFPLEDPFEKEFCSNFFSELGSPEPIKQYEEEKAIKFSASETDQLKHPVVPDFPTSQMPPPKFQFPESAQRDHNFNGSSRVINFSQFSAPLKGSLGKESTTLRQGEAKECSIITVGSSHCGSNQIPNDQDFSRASKSAADTTGLSAEPIEVRRRNMMNPPNERETETIEPTLTSSSGASGSSFGKASKQSTGVNSLKRKGRDVEESECQSEAAEFESAPGNQQARKSKSARRSRAAEIHNLSERRRRDRINEKMRALQELIPHCNKTDKASMLDEAIEYLKSLQLQLQVMWMGGGMAPMIFPGVHHYMSRMGMGIGPPPLTPMSNTMHLPRFPLVDHPMSLAPAPNQAIMCQPSLLNPVNLQNQMQNPSFSEQYARCLGLQHLQAASQPMNMFRLGSQALSQGQTTAPSVSSCGPLDAGTATDDVLNGKMKRPNTSAIYSNHRVLFKRK